MKNIDNNIIDEEDDSEIDIPDELSEEIENVESVNSEPYEYPHPSWLTIVLYISLTLLIISLFLKSP